MYHGRHPCFKEPDVYFRFNKEFLQEFFKNLKSFMLISNKPNYSFEVTIVTSRLML